MALELHRNRGPAAGLAYGAFHREPDEPGTLDAVLALDAYDPRPLSGAELRDISGE